MMQFTFASPACTASGMLHHSRDMGETSSANLSRVSLHVEPGFVLLHPAGGIIGRGDHGVLKLEEGRQAGRVVLAHACLPLATAEHARVLHVKALEKAEALDTLRNGAQDLVVRQIELGQARGIPAGGGKAWSRLAWMLNAHACVRRAGKEAALVMHPCHLILSRGARLERL